MTRAETKAALLRVIETVPVEQLVMRGECKTCCKNNGGCALERALGMPGTTNPSALAYMAGITLSEAWAISEASDSHDLPRLRSLIEAL